MDANGSSIGGGSNLGDLRTRTLGMEWVDYSDKPGVELAPRDARTLFAVIPRTLIFGNIEDEEWLEFERRDNGIVR